MSQFYLDAAQAITLNLASTLIREKYMTDVATLSWRHGQNFTRLFKPSEELVFGDGITQQAITRRSDSARSTRTPLADFGNATKMTGAKVKVRWSDTDPTAHDFCRLEGIAELSLMALQPTDMTAEAINVAEEVERQVNQNIEDSFPILANAKSNGRLCLINGDIKNNSDVNYTDCTTFTANGTTARFLVDGGSTAPLWPGAYIDIRNTAGTLLADNLQITHCNPADGTAGVFSVAVTTTDETTTGDLDGLAADDDNSELFRSGEYGSGYRGSFREWFDAPAASFIGGVDRSAAAYQWLNPIVYEPGTATVPVTISRDHFDTLAQSMQYVNEDGMSVVFAGHTDLVQTLRRSIGTDATFNTGVVNDGEYTFGEMGITYIHPQFGKVTIVGDYSMSPDRMHALSVQTWKRFYYKTRGFQWLPGDSGMGLFFRKAGSRQNGGKSMFVRAEGFQNDTIWCDKPSINGAIMHVKK